MKAIRPILVATLLFLIVGNSGAVVTNGGKGSPHTRAAWVTETGRLSVLTHTRFWGKVRETKSGTDNLTHAFTVWDVQGLVALNYGLGKHFDLTLSPVAYQDLNQGAFDSYPWDTFLALKIGSFGSKASSLKYGLELNARFPTGDAHNVMWEDYTAGKTEFGFTGLVSYAYDPLYPEDSFNMHLNVGYIHHNDVGQMLTDDKAFAAESQVLSPSQEGIYSLALTIPTESFDYGLEWWGNVWLQRPPLAAASRENYLYLDANVTYKPYRWFSFFVSGDYRLSADKDETIGPRRAPAGLPNYSTWRMNVGAKFVLLPTSIFHLKERDILMQKAQSRRELFEQIIKERRETESAEEELDRIKNERRKAERELERLRKILEGQQQTDENKKLEKMRPALTPPK